MIIGMKTVIAILLLILGLPIVTAQGCTDSDGSDVNVKGSVVWTDASGSKRTDVDVCFSESMVREWVCGADGYANNQLLADCAHGCLDGACKSATCTDSDGGYYPNKFGTVSWTDQNGVPITTDDLCIGSSASVMEAVCDAKGYANNAQTFNCPNGCSNGACISATCTDSDGSDVNAKGSVVWADASGNKRTDFDVCFSDSKVREWVCGADGYANNQLLADCAHGCLDGACKSAPGFLVLPIVTARECNDSDGSDVNAKGSVVWTDASGSKRTDVDVCFSESMVREWVCGADGYANNQLLADCAHGCLDGACKSAPGLKSVCIDKEFALCVKNQWSTVDPRVYCKTILPPPVSGVIEQPTAPGPLCAEGEVKCAAKLRASFECVSGAWLVSKSSYRELCGGFKEDACEKGEIVCSSSEKEYQRCLKNGSFSEWTKKDYLKQCEPKWYWKQLGKKDKAVNEKEEDVIEWIIDIIGRLFGLNRGVPTTTDAEERTPPTTVEP